MSSKVAAADTAPIATESTGPLTTSGRLLCFGVFAWLAGELLYAFAINDRLTIMHRFDQTDLFSREVVDGQAILADHFRIGFLVVLIAGIAAFAIGWALFVSKALSLHRSASGPGPALAAISIFVPGLNLFMPGQTLRQIWNKVDAINPNGRTLDRSRAFQWAFSLCIVLGAGSLLLGLAVGGHSKTLYELHTDAQSGLYLTSLGLWMASALMAVVSGALLLSVVEDILKADAQG